MYVDYVGGTNPNFRFSGHRILAVLVVDVCRTVLYGNVDL